MQLSKSIVLLCLFNELQNTNQLDPKKIIEQYDINNRQMWGYIKNLKEYYILFSNKTLIYNTSKKKYYLYEQSEKQ